MCAFFHLAAGQCVKLHSHRNAKLGDATQSNERKDNSRILCRAASWLFSRTASPKPYHLLPRLNPGWFTFLVPT